MKINLSEIPTIDSIFDVSLNFNMLQQKSVTSLLKNNEKMIGFSSLLVCLKEQAEFFAKMLSNEFAELKNTDDNNFADNYILQTLYEVYSDVGALNNVYVFNSLSKISETNIVVYFSEEFLLLRDLIVKELQGFTSHYEAIKPSDEHYENVSDKSMKILVLVSNIKKTTQENMQRSAQDFIGSKSLDQQLAFFAMFFEKHFFDKWSRGFLIANGGNGVHDAMLLSHKKMSEDEEDVIDVVEDGVKKEETNEQKMQKEQSVTDETKEILESISQSNQIIIETLGALADKKTEVQSGDREANENLSECSGKIDLLRFSAKAIEERLQHSVESIARLEEKISQRLDALDALEDISIKQDSLNKTIEKLDEFLEKQKRVEEILKERHKIEF